MYLLPLVSSYAAASSGAIGGIEFDGCASIGLNIGASFGDGYAVVEDGYYYAIAGLVVVVVDYCELKGEVGGTRRLRDQEVGLFEARIVYCDLNTADLAPSVAIDSAVAIAAARGIEGYGGADVSLLIGASIGDGGELVVGTAGI